MIGTRLTLLAALTLPIVAGCVALPGPGWIGTGWTGHAPTPPKPAKPKRTALTAREAYARMNEIEDGVRIVVASEHRRLRRAKTGAGAEARRAALAASLANLAPVLQGAEAGLRALRSAPAEVRPFLDLRIARTHDARAALRTGLAEVRRGQRREFGGWRERGPRERRAETDLRRELGLARTELPPPRVASAFDARGRASGLGTVAAPMRPPVAVRPETVRGRVDPFGPSRAEIRRDRGFFRVAAGAIRIVRDHNAEGDRFLAAIRAGLPGDPDERRRYLADVYDVALAEDERVQAALRALGPAPGEAKAYIEATRRQFEAGDAEMRRIFASTEDAAEVVARANAYLQSVERQRLIADSQRAADAMNARLRRISLRGTVPREDWAILRP